MPTPPHVPSRVLHSEGSSSAELGEAAADPFGGVGSVADGSETGRSDAPGAPRGNLSPCDCPGRTLRDAVAALLAETVRYQEQEAASKGNNGIHGYEGRRPRHG